IEPSDDEDAKRIYELSRVREEKPGDVVSFRHLITLIQIYHDDSGLLSALKRGGYMHDSISGDLRNEMDIARSWLNAYGPEQMKFTLLPTDAPVDLGDAEKSILREFLQTVQSISWDAESIHNRIHEILRSANTEPKDGFSIFYRVLIGKTRGPRLGYFLSNLDRDWVMKRFRAAVS
ncbi:MAG: lysine--tRNA ligase, partial [Thermoplasmataceae archaeon]